MFAPEMGKTLGVAFPALAGSDYSATMSQFIYKIAPEAPWREAEANGRFTGAPIDVADGFIHFSTAAQVRETAAKHFAGQTGPAAGRHRRRAAWATR